jgi:hypothetical protein
VSASQNTPPAAPIRYQPSFEVRERDEAQTGQEINATMHKIQEITCEDGKRPLRAVHAKSHGLLRGELRVLEGLPEVLAQGMFARGGTYPVVLRISTTPGDILDDGVSTPRALAIKVVGVEGDRLLGSEGATTQDFILINGPAFLKKDGKSFASSLKLLAATTDKAPGLKKVLSAVLRGAEQAIESVGGESPTLINLGGQPQTHPLGDTFYSATPYLYGEYMVKVCATPVSPGLTALTKQPVDLRGKPNGLREAIIEFFAARGAEWELRVQLCTDLSAMPIEDAKTVWPEDRSPYVAVARILVPPQTGWSEARSRAVDDGMAFSPWHGLAAHRPLGSVNRLRRQAYEMARQFRASRNGHSVGEPRSLDDFPS